MTAQQSFTAVMEQIPDPVLREKVRILRQSPLVQTPKALAKLRRDVAKLLHPDTAKCPIASLALSLFNAKLDSFMNNVAKGYVLDVPSNTWVRKNQGL